MIALFSALFVTLSALIVTALAAALIWGLNKRLGDTWASRDWNLRTFLSLARSVGAVVVLLAVVAGAWTGAALIWGPVAGSPELA